MGSPFLCCALPKDDRISPCGVESNVRLTVAVVGHGFSSYTVAMRALIGIIAAAASLVILTSVVAHAAPVKVTPGDGAVLNAPPAEIIIEMTQDMAREGGANDIDVLDSSGREVTTIAAVVDNGNRKRLSVALPTSLAIGKYSVKWKSLSADDGDAAEGTLTFTYDPSKPPDPGKTTLKEDLLSAPGAGQSAPTALGGTDSGRSWVLVVAVAIAAFALGGGGTFLLVQKRP